MRLLSLFSGGGLGDFGFMAAGMEIIGQVEIDEYCQKVLALRYPDSKKYRDIKILKGSEFEPVDIITGGFPCQPFSYAGKRTGKEDNRYLWPEMLRVIKECKPRWVVGENVPVVINLALDTVCADLEAESYEVWPIVFPSHALGAWHKRDRVWIVAYRGHDGWSAEQQQQQEERSEVLDPSCKGNVADTTDARLESVREWKDAAIDDVPNTKFKGLEGQRKSRENHTGWNRPSNDPWSKGWWQSEPAVGRVANGIADRIHRLKMLGNGQVPACTYVIGQMIMEIEDDQ